MVKALRLIGIWHGVTVVRRTLCAFTRVGVPPFCMGFAQRGRGVPSSHSNAETNAAAQRWRAARTARIRRTLAEISDHQENVLRNLVG